MLKKRKFQCVIMSAICAASVVSFTGCQKSPESSIVVNKDLDELIEQAENSEGDGLILEQKYDTYKTTLEDKSLKVKVNVDAKVDVPRADKMSLFRVSKQQITQELLDAVRKELLGDVKLYDGKVLKQTTKSDIEALIEVYRKQMENAEDQVIYQESQSAIEALEEEYNSAPADISFENIEAIDKFLSVSEKYNENPSDELYGWLYSLVPEGNVFFGVSDGSDDNYSMLYAVNSEDYGNYLSFRTGKHGYENMGVNGFRPANYAGTDMSGNKITPISDETAELSLEKAVGIADQFLETVGINNGTTEFRYCEGGLTKEKLYIDKKYDLEGIPERTYYVLTYTRYIDGAFITPGVADKYNENNEEGAFSKKIWPAEKIEFRINDSGIVGFDYVVPVSITETVVEKSSMKTFEQICDTFKKMSVVTNATEEFPVQLDVERITLGYSLVSEPDSFDTALLVPVWDFIGTKTIEHEKKENSIILTINAIDGSIINRELGY